MSDADIVCGRLPGDFMHNGPFNLSGKGGTHRDRPRHGAVSVPHGNRADQQVHAFRLHPLAAACRIGCRRGNQYDFGRMLKLLVGFVQTGGETEEESGPTPDVLQYFLDIPVRIERRRELSGINTHLVGPDKDRRNRGVHNRDCHNT